MSLNETITARDLADELALNRPQIPQSPESPDVIAWRQWTSDVRGIANVLYGDNDEAKREFYKASQLPWTRGSI